MKRILSVLVLLTFFITLFNLVFAIRDSFFYNMDDLPYGEFLYSSMSPSGERTVKFYKVESVMGNAVRGEVVSTDEKGNSTHRNIYWKIGPSTVVSGWLDDASISIDGDVVNTSTNDFFDCRRELNINNKALDEKIKMLFK